MARCVLPTVRSSSFTDPHFRRDPTSPSPFSPTQLPATSRLPIIHLPPPPPPPSPPPPPPPSSSPFRLYLSTNTQPGNIPFTPEPSSPNPQTTTPSPTTQTPRPFEDPLTNPPCFKPPRPSSPPTSPPPQHQKLKPQTPPKTILCNIPSSPSCRKPPIYLTHSPTIPQQTSPLADEEKKTRAPHHQQ